MNRNASFVRKIVYISVMALLLIPLSYLSQPSGFDVSKHKGGKLDQLRRDYDLSQSSLGEVDPTSETMKLASLGMRGVATTILWQQAHEHKKKENWDAFGAVLRQISKLQPHFIQVWIFQAWNQSYNVSVEFDNYEYRYHWVKKGIDFLIEGSRYNTRDVKLQWQLGWVFGHKIGRSDERRQFRRLFKDDKDFHDGLGINFNATDVSVRDYQGNIDNWLLAREFFLRAIRIAESPNGSKEWGQSPVLFFSEPAMQRMNYAETILEEGYFGRAANEAWRDSGKEWTAFGDRSIATTVSGVRIKLNELEKTQADIVALSNEFETWLTGLEEIDADIREEIRQEKIAALPEEQRKAFETPDGQRTEEQRAIAAGVQRLVEVEPEDILARIPDAKKEEGQRLILRLKDLQLRARYMDSYRDIVNFKYWATRCEAEQTETMVDARRDLHDAAILYEQGIFTKYNEVLTDPVTGEPVIDQETGQPVEVERLGAKEIYERGFQGFAKIFQEYPVMLDNPETEDILVHIQDYGDLLGQLEQEIPDDFSLRIVLEIFSGSGQRRQDSMILAEAWARRMNPRMAEPSPPVPAADDEADGAASEADPRSKSPRPPMPEQPDDVSADDSDPRAIPARPPQPATGA